jgi:Retrotransposon gag protein
MASTSTTAVSIKTLGSAPKPFNSTTANAEAFWTNLANYYFLNNNLYSTTSKQIASALTHFKLGTPAGEWAKDRQQMALAHNPPDFGTWTDFQDAFKSHFIPVDTKLLSTQLLHTIKMNNKPFSEWYQEWSTHANCSGANKETKMYAFHQNIPAALHQKIIGVSPTPTIALPRLLCTLSPGPQDSEEADRLGVNARADCLRLTSLSFDSELTLWAAINRWTACVTRRPYGLEPGMVSP